MPEVLYVNKTKIIEFRGIDKFAVRSRRRQTALTFLPMLDSPSARAQLVGGITMEWDIDVDADPKQHALQWEMEMNSA